MTALAERTGRRLSSLSRTLRALEQRGLVAFEPAEGRSKRPVVSYDRIELVTTPLADAA